MDSKDRLTIVYEPEAVASWCNTFGWSKFSDYGQSVDSGKYLFLFSFVENIL